MGFQKVVSTGIIALMLLVSCGSNPEINPDMLDGEVIFDPTIYDPALYLVSYSNPTPDATEAATPVIIVSHGYSASTFEWDEFREWNASGSNDFLISQVLMAGHGRTYEEFKESTWDEWKIPILDEYERLLTAGYTNISFAGTSTSCTLLIETINSGYFDNKLKPQNIFLIDPIIIPSSKILSLIGIVGPMLGYVEADNTTEEDMYWYHFRPQETLNELMKLLTIVRKDLQKGITVPSGTFLKVYKSKKDPTADPASAVLIFKGLKNSDGSSIEVEMIESSLHVFTRLDLRSDLTQRDIANQEYAFLDMRTQLVR